MPRWRSTSGVASFARSRFRPMKAPSSKKKGVFASAQGTHTFILKGDGGPDPNVRPSDEGAHSVSKASIFVRRKLSDAMKSGRIFRTSVSLPGNPGKALGKRGSLVQHAAPVRRAGQLRLRKPDQLDLGHRRNRRHKGVDPGLVPRDVQNALDRSAAAKRAQRRHGAVKNGRVLCEAVDDGDCVSHSNTFAIRARTKATRRASCA